MRAEDGKLHSHLEWPYSVFLLSFTVVQHVPFFVLGVVGKGSPSSPGTEKEEEENDEIKTKLCSLVQYLGNGWSDFLQIWYVDSHNWPARL